jgi:hypothetical protein
MGGAYARFPCTRVASKKGEDISKRIRSGRPGSTKKLVLFGKWNRGWKPATSNWLLSQFNCLLGINGLASRLNLALLSCALRLGLALDLSTCRLVNGGAAALRFPNFSTVSRKLAN